MSEQPVVSAFHEADIDITYRWIHRAPRAYHHPAGLAHIHADRILLLRMNSFHDSTSCPSQPAYGL